MNGDDKLYTSFYAPYRVTRNLGEVAYELELPEGIMIHNVFHVSFLQKAIGKKFVA